MHLITARGGGTSEHDPPFINYPQEPYPDTGDPTVGARITVLDDSNHNAFPGLALIDGVLVGIWRAATLHEVQTGASRGVLKMAQSNDLGRSWSSPVTVVDDDPDDVRDAVLATLADGRLALSYMTNDGTSGATWVRISDDGGTTWGGRVAAQSGSASFVSGPVVELADGTLLLAVYGGGSAVLVKSTDGGASFGDPVTIASSGGTWTEPYLLLLDDGTLLVGLRENSNRDIHISSSTDDGATWSTPSLKFDGWGRPSLVQFSSGMVVCQYRLNAGTTDGTTEQHLMGRSSRDGGDTWDAEYTIDDTRRMAYTQPVEVSGGQVGLLYSMENAGGRLSDDANIYFRYLIDGAGITPVGDDTLTAASHFLGLGDTPSSYSGQAGKAAVVNDTEDALEFADALGADGVRDAGRWEAVVDGSPPTAVTNEAEDDWVYGWISG